MSHVQGLLSEFRRERVARNVSCGLLLVSYHWIAFGLGFDVAAVQSELERILFSQLQVIFLAGCRGRGLIKRVTETLHGNARLEISDLPANWAGEHEPALVENVSDTFEVETVRAR